MPYLDSGKKKLFVMFLGCKRGDPLMAHLDNDKRNIVQAMFLG
jgi:hypothetical protein